MQDYTLLEHPISTIRRLKSADHWPEASRLLHRVKQQRRRQLESHRAASRGALLELVRDVDHQLQVAKAGWDAVQRRWPPPSDIEPLTSLAAYLRTERGPGRDGVDRTRPKMLGMPPISKEAERRFEQIGDKESIREDVLWVYGHLDDGNVDATQAPNLESWVLLDIARGDPLGFLAWIDRVCSYLESQEAEVATD